MGAYCYPLPSLWLPFFIKKKCHSYSRTIIHFITIKKNINWFPTNQIKKTTVVRSSLFMRTFTKQISFLFLFSAFVCVCYSFVFGLVILQITYINISICHRHFPSLHQEILKTILLHRSDTTCECSIIYIDRL